MRATLLLAAFLVTALFVVGWTLSQGEPARKEMPAGGPVEEREEAPPTTALAVHAERSLEDPCGSLRAELEEERRARQELEAEMSSLRETLRQATVEVQRLRFPEDTPYGAFLASPEYQQLLESIRSGSYLYEEFLNGLREDLERSKNLLAEKPSAVRELRVIGNTERLERLADPDKAAAHLLGRFKSVLENCPVVLQPGEATWIVENMFLGTGGKEELVYLLGPSRLAAEIPVDKLLEEYLGEEGYGPKIQAALPPAKRAELADRLAFLAEAARHQPEDLERLRSGFPSCFIK